MDSSPSETSRRRVLRRLGGGIAAVGLASTAGCTAPRAVTSSGGGVTGTEGPKLDASQFGAYLREMRTRYGPHGVFGSRGPPDASSFEIAWTEEFTTGSDPSSDDDGLVRADYAIARYHLGESGDGDRMDAWLLWAGARPTAETTTLPGLPGGYEPRAAVRVRGLGLYAEFDAPASLVHYDPGGDVKSSQTDEYTVQSGVQSGPAVAANAPLETGTVRPQAPKTWDASPETGFDSDSYTVGWRGRSADAVSVVAVCTTALPADADVESTALLPSFEYHAAAGGYLFA